MDLVRITYTGRKFYRDKTALRNEWNPGDTKLVPEPVAKVLRRFGVFVDAESQVAADEKTQEAEVAEALLQQQVVEAKLDEQKTELEAMLTTIESMDKGALEEYARKYEVELDKRRGVAKLREEVSLLVEQYGVR